ncbi:MAG: phosphoribosylformylglycinamidine cyclo-ligase [Nitrospira sp.]|nr:phosphoribosylformylglycinamidine cyclo-ligase [Nitrospira sp.]
MSDASPDAYRESGVDTTLAVTSLAGLTERFRKTWTIPTGQPGNVRLPFGLFANVIEIGHNQGIAMTADGVGSKVLIAQRMGRYDTVGIDCVAMNVNDLLCVGATPLAMVDTLAVQELDPDCLRGIAEGLTEGARQAGISIPGGELAQMRDVVKNEAGKEGKGFDLTGSAIGIVALDRIIIGEAVQPGDVVIGIASNGVHSNGLTLARNALAQDVSLYDKPYAELGGQSLGKELLKPTHIYTREVLPLLNGEGNLDVRALIHLTGDGFLNLARVRSRVTFVLDTLPPLPPVFPILQRLGGVAAAEMFAVFNMGIGFCLVVPAHQADRTIQLVTRFGKRACRIGYVADRDRDDWEVIIKTCDVRLRGKGSRFETFA